MALKPNTRYTWPETATFNLDHKEFGTLLNTLNSIVGNPLWENTLNEAHQKVFEGSQVLAVGRLHELMTSALDKAVEAGIAVEVVEEVPADSPTAQA